MAPWWIIDALCVVMVVLHTLAALALTGHALAWVHLLWLRRRPRRARAAPPASTRTPRLLLQLPLFNEEAVVDGLLDAVAALDWPRDRFAVQVLDDSTDRTPARVAARLPGLRAEGLCIDHLRRADRTGFKAGALAAGLLHSDAELVAILDADFRPRPDWLRVAVARLSPDVGLVQCRWSFTNAGSSVLTRAQALHLDAHFAVEQAGRSAGGLMLGFNGTAGVWRRAAIDAAGGWEGDTLTEDLDLAYRAQLAGQRLVYADDLDVPCELPERLDAVRAQQHRWIRGGAQVAAKLLRRLWRDEPALRRRVQGTLHLLASSLFIPVLALCVITPLTALLRAVGPAWIDLALAPAGLMLRAVPVVLVVGYFVACRARAPGAGSGRSGRGRPGGARPAALFGARDRAVRPQRPGRPAGLAGTHRHLRAHPQGRDPARAAAAPRDLRGRGGAGGPVAGGGQRGGGDRPGGAGGLWRAAGHRLHDAGGLDRGRAAQPARGPATGRPPLTSRRARAPAARARWRGALHRSRCNAGCRRRTGRARGRGLASRRWGRAR